MLSGLQWFHIIHAVKFHIFQCGLNVLKVPIQVPTNGASCRRPRLLKEVYNHYMHLIDLEYNRRMPLILQICFLIQNNVKLSKRLENMVKKTIQKSYTPFSDISINFPGGDCILQNGVEALDFDVRFTYLSIYTYTFNMWQYPAIVGNFWIRQKWKVNENAEVQKMCLVFRRLFHSVFRQTIITCVS